MKKSIILAIFFIFVSSAVFAEGIYFDAGFGFGPGWTKFNGNDEVDFYKSMGAKVDETSLDISFKIGYGPISNLPLYIVGELGGTAHRLDIESNHIQFNSYLIGPGVLYYPIPLIQLGFSIGLSRVGIVSNVFSDIEGGRGFAWNISAAVDLGAGKHGCLIGLKYFYTNNTLELSKDKHNNQMVSVFVKYAFRDKEALSALF